MMGDITGGATTMTLDIWVDDKDLPVRLKQDMDAMKVTMDFEKFGKTAEVKAPPASQTADMTEAVKDSQGQ